MRLFRLAALALTITGVTAFTGCLHSRKRQICKPILDNSKDGHKAIYKALDAGRYNTNLTIFKKTKSNALKYAKYLDIEKRKQCRNPKTYYSRLIQLRQINNNIWRWHHISCCEM